MSIVKNYVHIVFRTYASKCTLKEENKRVLLSYIFEVCKEKGVYLKRVNSYRNHVHMLINLPSTMALSDFMESLKCFSSKAFRRSESFPEFDGWAKGYGAFSVSHWDISKVSKYIANQAEHHRVESMDEELQRIAREAGVDINEYFYKDM